MTTTTGSTSPNPVEGRKVGEIPSFDVTLRIRRYNPEVDAEPHWEDYTVSVTAPTACSTPCTRSSGRSTAR